MAEPFVINPSTPKSDQFQISIAASPEKITTEYEERVFSSYSHEAQPTNSH